VEATFQLNRITLKDLYFDQSSKKSRLISTVHFSLQIPNRDVNLPECSVEVTQPWGTQFGEPIEIGPPAGYDGPWDTIGFSDILEEYLLFNIGPEGKIVRIDKESDHLGFKNSIVKCQSTVLSMQIPDE